MQEDIIVLKLGSSVLETQEDLPDAVHEIYRWYRSGYRVVAVVSAIGDTTDHLLAQAGELAHAPDSWSCAELLATGERASAALLGVALDRSGVPARIVDPREIGLTVAGDALDSEPVSLDADRLKSLLTDHPVVIIPGFFGTAADGRVHLLGRGDAHGASEDSRTMVSNGKLHVRAISSISPRSSNLPSAILPSRFIPNRSRMSFSTMIERKA